MRSRNSARKQVARNWNYGASSRAIVPPEVRFWYPGGDERLLLVAGSRVVGRLARGVLWKVGRPRRRGSRWRQRRYSQQQRWYCERG